MKKYLFILISVSCFGQFNPVQWYEFSKPKNIDYLIFYFSDIDEAMIFLNIEDKYNLSDWTDFLTSRGMSSSPYKLEVNGDSVKIYFINPKITSLGLNDMQLISFEIKGFEKCNYLNISNNDLEYMYISEPSLSSAPRIDLNGNLVTTFIWNNNTEWIANVKNNGRLFSFGNINLVEGTNTYDYLLAKGWVFD